MNKGRVFTMYRGDEYIGEDTIEKLAKISDVKLDRLRWCATPRNRTELLKHAGSNTIILMEVPKDERY